MLISSSYAKILGETSGSKAKDGKEEREKKERRKKAKVGNTHCNATSGGARKASSAKIHCNSGMKMES